MSVAILCLVILAGRSIYVSKTEKFAKSKGNHSLPSAKNFPSSKWGKDIYHKVKIKKTSSPNILSLSQESQGENSFCNSEIDINIKNMPKIIQEFTSGPENYKWKKRSFN